MNVSSIWPPDWSQFLPDLILTLIVGGGVALALWVVQTRTERRTREMVARAQWWGARAELIGSSIFVLMVHEGPLDYGRKELRWLLKRLRKWPLHDWLVSLPKDKGLPELDVLLRATPNMLKQASRLELKIKLQVAQIYQDRRAQFILREAVRLEIYELTADWSQEDAYLEALRALPRKEAVARVLESRDFESNTWYYIQLRRRVDGAWMALRRMFAPEAPDPKEILAEEAPSETSEMHRK